MTTITKLYDLYAYDNLRGDGFAVRLARLDMVSSNFSLVWALCWAMEALFAMYFVSEDKNAKVAYLAAFYFAWLNILQVVY
jgi:hypothetical protein